MTSHNEQHQPSSEEARRLRAEREQYLADLQPPCPRDQQPGSYLHQQVGSPQTVVPVFQCPQGHIFSYRLDIDTPGAEKGYYIPPQEWEQMQRGQQEWDRRYGRPGPGPSGTHGGQRSRAHHRTSRVRGEGKHTQSS